jgi:alkanesulfonate monooxygenase SsuD/methylene tetrahydromethanopterin reductase-like flavin-dependent oxidoreductase (luciferase family)
LKTPDGVRQAMEWVAEGAKNAGRDPTEIDTVIRIPTFVDEDAASVQAAARWSIASYGMVDVYNRSLRAQGFADVSDEIARLWRDDRDAAMKAIPDEMIDQLFLTGDLEKQQQHLEAFRAAGINTPVLLPIAVVGDGQEKLERVTGAVKALAPA